MSVKVKLLLSAIIVALPALAWAYIKPIRVIAPEAVGLTCIDGFVCIDDVSRAEEAKKLYADAIEFVRSEVGEINKIPTASFCSTKACSSSFGLHNGSHAYAGAYNVGTFGLVISYRGWHPYFVRHELIHHVQNERLGSLQAWFFKPNWFKEGMAYSLSKDPREPLPKTLETYRTKYETWAENLSSKQLWDAAERL